MITFNELIKIDRKKLNDEMSKQSEYLYEIGRKVEIIWHQKEKIRLQLEQKENYISATTRMKYKRLKDKPSETNIKEIVSVNEEVCSLRNDLLELEKGYRLARLRKEVLKTKGEMLMNISHNVREENKRN